VPKTWMTTSYRTVARAEARCPNEGFAAEWIPSQLKKSSTDG